MDGVLAGLPVLEDESDPDELDEDFVEDSDEESDEDSEVESEDDPPFVFAREAAAALESVR